MVQEGPGCGFYMQLLAGAADRQPVQCLHGRGGLALRGPEGRKIVMAENGLGGGVHGFVIEPHR